MRLLFIFLAFIVLPQTSAARPPILLDAQTIDVTTNFRGTEIRVTTHLEGADPSIRMVIAGPPATLTFRQKARRAGLWVNAEKEVLHNAASYVALVGISEQELNAACARFALKTIIPTEAIDLTWLCNRQQRALMAEKSLFAVVPPSAGISGLGDGFHRAAAFLPATAKPGTYIIRFWSDDESVQTTLDVRRAGLERWVLHTAENYRILYGLICLLIAGLAGYLTNLIFSRRT